MPHECIAYDGNAPYLKPKQVIKKTNLKTGESTEYIVGTINESGGVCGCCCNVSPYALDNQEFEKKEFGEEPTFKVELVDELFSSKDLILYLSKIGQLTHEILEYFASIGPSVVRVPEGHVYK